MAVEKITEIKISSKIYPHRLKHIPSAPKAIYCRGNIELLKSEVLGNIHLMVRKPAKLLFEDS